MRIRILLLVGGLLCSLPLAGFAAGASRVAGEASKTVPQAPLHWRASQFPSQSVAKQVYRELPVARLLELEQYNARRQMKPMKVGIARAAAAEGAIALPQLRWLRLRDGGAVTRLQFRSPDAMGLRVGLQIFSLDPRAELRFAGSLDSAPVVAMIRGNEVNSLTDGQRLFWTPATDGELQTVEIYLPRGADPRAVRLGASQLSHLMANSADDFKILKSIGESGSCNVNAVCSVPQLGAAYARAKDAVAHMVFTKAGESFSCTGTLLADTDASTQIPYFYSAHHCISDQAVASTLNTFWGFESSNCNGSGVSNGIRLIGGAQYLYSNAATDALFLRLNNPAPAGAQFAGWDVSLLPISAQVIGIHHPSGDLKKISLGRSIFRDASRIEVGWLSGTTEGGSSGSGLFTAEAGGYALRGGLFGGSASCANTGSLANPLNRDLYSRFDVVFPNIRQYLAAVPIRVNGSQPLVPPVSRAVDASAPAASAVPPVSVPAASIPAASIPAASIPAASAVPAVQRNRILRRLPLRTLRTGSLEP